MQRVLRRLPVAILAAAFAVLLALMTLPSDDGLQSAAAASIKRARLDMPSQVITMSGVTDVKFICAPSETFSPDMWSIWYNSRILEVNCVPETGVVTVSTPVGLYLGDATSPYNAAVWRFQYTDRGSDGCYFHTNPGFNAAPYDASTGVLGTWRTLGPGKVCTGNGQDYNHSWFDGTLGPWHYGVGLNNPCTNTQYVIDRFTMQWTGTNASYYTMNGQTPTELTLRAYVCNVPITSLPWDQTLAPHSCPICSATQNQDWTGGPINTRTGNYHYSQQDISLPALGGPLRFERSYNALATNHYTATLGYGWTHNYDARLVLSGMVGSEPNMIILNSWSGSRFRFVDNGDGTFQSFPGVWATLTRTLEAFPTYALRAADQSAYTFKALLGLVG